MNWSAAYHQSERLLLYQRMQASYITPLGGNMDVSDWYAILTDKLLHYIAWAISQFGIVYAAVLTLAPLSRLYVLIDQLAVTELLVNSINISTTLDSTTAICSCTNLVLYDLNTCANADF